MREPTATERQAEIEGRQQAGPNDLLDKIGGLIGGGDSGEPAKDDAAGDPPPKPGFQNELEKAAAEKAAADRLAAGDETPPAGDEKPQDLKALAEKAGVPIEDLYGVNMGLAWGEEPVTLGQLKDRVQEATKIKGRELAIEEQKTAFENEMLTARAEFESLVTILGDVPDAKLQGARAQLQRQLEVEAQRTVTEIPSWRDAETRAGDMKLIGEHLAAYGQSEQVLLYQPAWVRKYVRDNALREQRVRAAIEAKPERKPSKDARPRRGSPSPAGLKQKMKAAQESTDDRLKVSAVTDLLRSQK